MTTEIAAVLLWISLAVVFHAYVGFPIAIWVASRLFGHRPEPPVPETLPRVSVLVAALDEEDVIAQRIENALASDYPPELLEIVIGSDGSTDRTAAIVNDYANRFPDRVKLIDYPQRRGKATVLNESLPHLRSEIVVLSDANTDFDPNAIHHLTRWFVDSNVGAVCGKLVLFDSVSGRNADGLYWRYETFLKSCEGRLDALLGSNGAIYAIRRDEYVPIAADTIIDDFTIPLLIKLHHGKRIIYDETAIAREETAPNVLAEFRRRSRIGAGGFQSLSRLFRLLSPRYGWTSFAFWQHKVFRWICPAMLLIALASNLILIGQPFYLVVFLLQAAFYAAAAIGATTRGSGPLHKILRLTTLFTSMNLALAAGFWRWLAGGQRGTWQRTAR